MRTLALALLPLLLPAQVTIPPDKEAALGRSIAADMRKRVTVVEHEATREYLQTLAESFSHSLPESTPSFQFTLTQTTIHPPGRRPLALPAGYVFVPLSALTEASDEAAFARQLAHAIAHLSLRHGFRTAERTASGGSATIPIIYVGGWPSCSGTNLMIPMAMRAKSQQEETKADAFAERLLEHFQPNPNFGEVQAQLRALAPPPAPPTLRRPDDEPPTLRRPGERRQ